MIQAILILLDSIILTFGIGAGAASLYWALNGEWFYYPVSTGFALSSAFSLASVRLALRHQRLCNRTERLLAVMKNAGEAKNWAVYDHTLEQTEAAMRDLRNLERQ